MRRCHTQLRPVRSSFSLRLRHLGVAASWSTVVMLAVATTFALSAVLLGFGDEVIAWGNWRAKLIAALAMILLAMAPWWGLVAVMIEVSRKRE